MTQLLASAKNSFLWALNDRDALSTWSDQRVVLLGDACHPMLPFMAQGAAMAIEDAYILSESIQQHSVHDALKHYEALRKPRATEVQTMSRNNAGLYHMNGGLMGQMKLNAVGMASRLAPQVIQAKLDPIYGYDVLSSI